jgi:hypothetical protein
MKPFNLFSPDCTELNSVTFSTFGETYKISKVQKGDNIGYVEFKNNSPINVFFVKPEYKVMNGAVWQTNQYGSWVLYKICHTDKQAFELNLELNNL